MRRMAWAVYLWPGLPQLAGRGSWAALVVALGAGAMLQVALLATFVWTELLTPELRILYWVLLLIAWGVSAVLSGWLRDREAARSQGNEKSDNFREALDHYLQGRWVEAERSLGRLLRNDRRDIEARLMLATLLRHTRRWSEAGRQLDALARLEEAQKWEQEIRREAELLAAARLQDNTDIENNGETHVRTIHRPRPEGHAIGQPGSPAVQS